MLPLFLVLTLAGVSAYASPVTTYTRCAIKTTTEQAQAIQAQFLIDAAAAIQTDPWASTDILPPTPTTQSTLSTSTSSRPSIPWPSPSPECRHIDVVWHCISESLTMEGGYLQGQPIKDAMEVLNKNFATAGFRFVLGYANPRINADWFHNVTQGSAQDQEMKTRFHVGDRRTLNIYSVALDSGVLGYSSYPWDYAKNPKGDGVVISASSVPGGSATNYNQGKTLVHMVGHWLGLLHVFNEEGNCIDADFVADTPIQSSPSYGCPFSPNSCYWEPGLDSIHNHLDVSDDNCAREFTPGQIARMKSQSTLYRGLSDMPCWWSPQCPSWALSC